MQEESGSLALPPKAARPNTHYFLEHVWLFGLGAPGLRKPTWPKQRLRDPYGEAATLDREIRPKRVGSVSHLVRVGLQPFGAVSAFCKSAEAERFEPRTCHQEVQVVFLQRKSYETTKGQGDRFRSAGVEGGQLGTHLPTCAGTVSATAEPAIRTNKCIGSFTDLDSGQDFRF